MSDSELQPFSCVETNAVLFTHRPYKQAVAKKISAWGCCRKCQIKLEELHSQTLAKSLDYVYLLCHTHTHTHMVKKVLIMLWPPVEF